MNNGFELVDPQNVAELLKRVPLEARDQGENLFKAGRVWSLEALRPGTAYQALVEDGSTRRVMLEYDLVGWSGNCSCRVKNCAHIFAGLRALLSEHSTASVRSLSAGVAKPRKVGTLPKDGESASVARRLMAAHGRSLVGPESEFLRRLQKVYKRCKASSQVTYWDLSELGWRLKAPTWQPLYIWPSFPADEYEFWLYVANYVRREGFTLPEFMGPITDLSVVERRLAQWRREQEVEQWKRKLEKIRPQQSVPPSPLAETELRLVIEKEEAILERRVVSEGDGFERLKAAQVMKLAADYIDGRVTLDTQSELLWSFFSQRFAQDATTLVYFDEEAAGILRCILRASSLVGLVVDQAGMPINRVNEPLRWQLRDPGGEEEDYRLRLVCADQSAVPPILCIMPGQPTYYLTTESLFFGPPVPSTAINPEEETSIPAGALETGEGLAFVQSLGLPLPERVRHRVRHVPFRVRIQCSLMPIYLGSSRERCMVAVQAETDDGHVQTWTGLEWRTQRAPKRESSPGGQIVVFDRAALQSIPQLLAPLGLKSGPQADELSVRVSKRFPELFAAWLKTVPAGIEVELEGELNSFVKADVAGEVRLEVTETEIDWFDLHVLLNVTDTTLTAEEIKLLLNARGSYVRLQGKGWRRLHFALSPEEDERLARLGLSPRGLSAEPQRLHALQLADKAAGGFLAEEQAAQIERRASEIKTRVAPALPAGVTAELRPYQLEGFHFLAYLATNRFGGILADDMGLGKTLQALAWLLWLRETFSADSSGPKTGLNPGERPSLVVCPKSVMDNWHAEASRFTPGLRVRLWPASELGVFHQRVQEADLHVINYSQLRLLGESLASVRWLAVILDEGQYIKNPSSQTAQIARGLQAAHRLVLSGTPIENRLLDLWSLMTFAMPGVLGSRAQFASLYDSKGDPYARRRLSARVRPFLLRRTKAQVAQDLPDRIEEDLYCEIEGEQKLLYRAELKRAQQMLLRIKTQKELAQQHFHFLTSMLRLRQICCHPRLVSGESSAPSAKSEALLEQLEPLMDEGQKVLVFSQFVELLDLLRPLLSERQWPLFYLSGETENRGELVRQFQAAEGAAIFLISLKAGGFGLNLTAASYVVLFDPWWNPAVENQAIDRTHRIGQVNKVIAYRLLIKDSIEEKIRALQKQKQAVAEDVLGEAKFAQSLTLEDLQFLFAD